MRILLFIAAVIALAALAWWSNERRKEAEVTPPPAAEAGAEDPAAAETKTKTPSLPSFDIVRVDRSGLAVIAGRAKPGAAVSVFANGALLAETVAEADGSWVVTTDTPLDAGAVELSLSMTTTDGQTIQSDETIIIYVPQREGDRPLVLRTTPGGATEVLQEPREADGSLGPLSLDTIDYDDSGAVIFSGRAEPQRVVQIFIRQEGGDEIMLLGETQSDEAGRWTMTPSRQIPPGVYALTVIQLDAEGRPAYAIELPFERARPEDIDLSDGRVVVQPGNSLWRIARRAYGRGAQYTIIYEANADQIRDPDLIYPGQIFEVPEEEPERSDQE